MPRASNDPAILQAALVGLQFEKEKIDEKIREIQAELKGNKAPAAVKRTAKARPRRKMSAAARARIAAAQKKRWADFHKQKAAGA